MSKKEKEDKNTFMNLMTDFAFKHMFGSVSRKHILIQFLNIMFEKEGLHVYDVTYHDKEVLPKNIFGKVIKYDVYCTSPKNKEHFIVEMQRVHHPGFENRAILYAIRAAGNQLKKGQKYELKPVYTIFLVNFHMPNLKPKDLHDVRLMDIDSHEIFSDVLRLMFVTLPDAKKTWEQCTTQQEKIIYLIKNLHRMDKESAAYKSGEFEDLFNEAELDNMVAEDAVAYSESKLRLEDELAALDYNYEKGMTQGKIKGREEGRKEEKFEVARKMKNGGMSLGDIMLYTGLSEKQISDL